MAIVFPASPSVNETFTAGSITYKWDGAKWIGLGVTPADRLVEGSNSLEINASNQLVWTGGTSRFGGVLQGDQRVVINGAGGKTGTANTLLNYAGDGSTVTASLTADGAATFNDTVTSPFIKGSGADGTSADTALFQNTTSGGNNRVRINTFANGGGDPYIKFDAGGSNMIVGEHYNGTTNNKLVLGVGETPSSINGIEIDGNGTIFLKPTASNYQSIRIEGATYTNQNGSVRIKPITIPGSGTAQFMTFFQSNNGGSGSTVHNVRVEGSLTKGSGSFRIPHPLEELSTTHDLVHSFIEGPQADNIYRGQVDLVNGTATVNLDTSSRMTEGTFVLLNRNISVFTSNETDWIAVRGSVSGNVLTIEAQDNTSTATVSWMVVGERKDPHMFIADWTDDDGRVITEPPKSE